MKNKQKGFSLIELLIVVAIILIIAAIAIPNLLRSKMAANEASAVGSMRTLNTAAVTYSTTYGGYPSALTKLGPASPATSTSADLVDSVLAGGTKSGYSFSWSAAAPDASGEHPELLHLLTAHHCRHHRTALLLHRPVRRNPRQPGRHSRHQQHPHQLVSGAGSGRRVSFSPGSFRKEQCHATKQPTR